MRLLLALIASPFAVPHASAEPVDSASAGSAAGELQPRHLIASTHIASAAVVVDPARPYTTTLTVPRGATAQVAQMHLTVLSGDHFEITGQANGHPFMLLDVQPGDGERRINSNGVLSVHSNEPLNNSGEIYFANYLPEQSVPDGQARIKIEVLPLGKDSRPVRVQLEPASSLQSLNADYKELRLSAPLAISAKRGSTFKFTVTTSQRGEWPAPESVSLSAEQQGGLSNIRSKPLTLDQHGFGTYEVSGSLGSPGTVLVRLNGGYNNPSQLVKVGERYSSGTSPWLVGMVIALPFVLALGFAAANLRRNRS